MYILDYRDKHAIAKLDIDTTLVIFIGRNERGKCMYLTREAAQEAE